MVILLIVTFKSITGKNIKTFTTTCKVDYTYITQLKLQKRLYYSATHRQNVDVLQSNITFLFIFAVLVGDIRIVDLTRRCKLFSFSPLFCCFVILNIPVNYVCYFASVMRKQVNYQPLN